MTSAFIHGSTFDLFANATNALGANALDGRSQDRPTVIREYYERI